MLNWLTGRGETRSGGNGENTLSDGTTVQLALYKYESCPYCRRVLAALDQLTVNIEYRDVQADPKWRQDLQRRTRRTTVPCLLIDDTPMFESADIVRWLQERFPATAT